MVNEELKENAENISPSIQNCMNDRVCIENVHPFQ